MASNGNESVVPDLQIVGIQFVNKYYYMLNKDPSEAYRFYQDSSVLGRPGPDRQMKSATNIKDINELILSFDMRRYKVEICFADAQSSYENGVVVLVIGSLIDKANVRRNFTQSFVLAPQKKGDFYVLNDVFRFVDDEEDEADKVDETNNAANVINQAPTPPEPSLEPVAEPDPEQKAQPAVNQKTSSSWADSTETEEELRISSESGKTSVSETKVADVSHQNEKPSHAVTKTATVAPSIQVDAPKKSYASVIVNGSTKSSGSSPFVPVIRSEPSRPAAAPQSSKPTVSASQQPASRPTAAPQPSKSTAAQLLPAAEPSPPQVHAPEKNNDHEGKNNNTSVFVGNLPMDATEELLRATFVNFGPIKRNGIQIRSSQMNPTCYAFVEFESASAVKSALEASRISIGSRRANIEEKQSTNGAMRFNRAGYRDDNSYYYGNDNLRGRGNFNAGGNNGRNKRREA